MKKIIWITGFALIAVLAFGLAGYAYAQNQTPPSPEYPYGPGMMSGGYHGGMMGGRGMMGSWNGEYGPMHDSMVAAVAEALGLSVEEIETRHDAGETLWQIAESQGFSAEETQEIMLVAHDQALEDAVANGWLTQEQAEWMDAHMEGMWDGDSDGTFGGHCGGGRFGGATRWQGEN